MPGLLLAVIAVVFIIQPVNELRPKKENERTKLSAVYWPLWTLRLIPGGGWHELHCITKETETQRGRQTCASSPSFEPSFLDPVCAEPRSDAPSRKSHPAYLGDGGASHLAGISGSPVSNGPSHWETASSTFLQCYRLQLFPIICSL